MPPKRKAPASTTPSGRPQRNAAQGVNYAPSTRRTSALVEKEADRKVKDSKVTKPAARSTRSSRTTKATEETTKAGSSRSKKAAKEPAEAPKSGKRKREEEKVEDSSEEDGEESEVEPPKKRGRPAKAEQVKPAVAKKGQTSTSTKKGTRPTSTAAKKGKAVKAEQVSSDSELSSLEDEPTANDEQEEPGPLVEEEDGDSQYWLMKAEPDSRIEKGVDIAYPIDKLEKATDPEPWDGVRNFVARNNMRAMRKGDLAFFYHSNCKVPGIVGVMRIAEEHSVDESAFDPTHPYYDEKSDRSKPKWDCVKVEFVKKFGDIITLKTLKTTPQLVNMEIAQKAKSRLSVQKVSPAQWKFVLKMANESEDLGVASTVSGYEADTNGEADPDEEPETEGDLVAETAVKKEDKADTVEDKKVKTEVPIDGGDIAVDEDPGDEEQTVLDPDV